MNITVSVSRAMWTPPEIRKRAAERRRCAREAAAADLCSARTRNGGSCRARKEPGRKRCRFHGGLSTGPKSAEGKRKVMLNLRRKSSSPDVSGKDAQALARPDTAA
jgi:hypothetical protein